MEGDDPLAWLLANYGGTIRGDEDTPEGQVAIAMHWSVDAGASL